MKNINGKSTLKRTQKDYSLAFKLQVVDEVEKGLITYQQARFKYGIQGKITVLVWLRKHGNLDWKKPSLNFMSVPKSEETPAQKIKRLEKELEDERLKNKVLNTMIDISDQQYGTAIRKKYLSKQSDAASRKNK